MPTASVTGCSQPTRVNAHGPGVGNQARDVPGHGRPVATVPVTAADNGKVKYTLPRLGGGIYLVNATFTPDDAGTSGSSSGARLLFVLF